MPEAAHHLVSFAEYIQLLEFSNIKLEWVNGVVYAMAGGSPEHAAIVATVLSVLHTKLKGKDCKVYSSDLQVRTPTNLSTLPDVTVVCGRLETHPEDKNTVTNPTLIVEVLSPSTEAYDRGAKFVHYKSIPTLTDYLLVSVDKQNVDHWVRNEYNIWTCYITDVMTVLGVSLKVKEIYE